MELKDEAIKKELEQHIRIANYVDSLFCYSVSVDLLQKTIDLINRQQAEIARLIWEKNHFEFKVDDLNGKLEKFKEYRDIKNKAYEREIEKLQADIERLNGNLFTISNACMQRRNEAIKEFAERLESKYTKVVSCNAGYVYRTIKEVEKEMVGGENA